MNGKGEDAACNQGMSAEIGAGRGEKIRGVSCGVTTFFPRIRTRG